MQHATQTAGASGHCALGEEGAMEKAEAEREQREQREQRELLVSVVTRRRAVRLCHPTINLSG